MVFLHNVGELLSAHYPKADAIPETAATSPCRVLVHSEQGLVLRS